MKRPKPTASARPIGVTLHAGALLLLFALVGSPLSRAEASPDASAKSPSSHMDAEGAVEHPPAPVFTLASPHGEMIDSAYESRKITMVHFWASWCVPCMREIPMLNRLAERYEPKGAAVLAVAMSSGEAADLRQLERAYEIRHTVVMGTDTLATRFGGIPSFPTTFLVGKDGRILTRLSGSTEEIHRKIEDHLRRAVETEPAEPPKPAKP